MTKEALEELKKIYSSGNLPEEIKHQLNNAPDLDGLKKVLRDNKEYFQTAQIFANFDNEKNQDFLKNHLEELLDHLDVGIWVIDENKSYVYANQALLDLSGTPAKENILGAMSRGRTIRFDFLMSDKVQEENRPLTAYQDVTNFISGAHYRQLITQTPIYDEKGNVKYIIAVVEKLSHLNDRLKEAQNNHLKYILGQTEDNSSIQMIAQSPQMKEIVNTIKQIAPSNVPILLEGESGTGKEVIANEIHRRSNRNKAPMVAVNCSAIPETLFESELFGYEKGAFTGAGKNGKTGLLEQADGGTLFLDEVNSLPLSVQGKLLRALETKTFRRVGGTKDITSDFRIISATNRNLYELCKENKFRDDLFYRLNIIPIRIPPLRNRRDDILPLTENFVKLFSGIHDTNKVFSSEALEKIKEYSWPGNVRELRNFIERAIVVSGNDIVEISDVSSLIERENDYRFTMAGNESPSVQEINVHNDFSLPDYMANCERQIIARALQSTHTTYEAAKLLKISQSTFVKKKQKYGL